MVYYELIDGLAQQHVLEFNADLSPQENVALQPSPMAALS
jgi:hypothetical protein